MTNTYTDTIKIHILQMRPTICHTIQNYMYYRIIPAVLHESWKL